jgi:hypothetical protein
MSLGFAKLDWSEDRIYRRAGISVKLLDGENLVAELTGRQLFGRRHRKILDGAAEPPGCWQLW